LLDQHRQRVVAALKAEKAASEAGENNRYLAALSEAGRLRSERRPGWTWAARDKVETAAATFAPARDRGALRSELSAAVAAIDLRPVGTAAVGLYAGAVAFAPDGRLAVAPQLVYPLLKYRYVLLIDPRTKAEKQLPFSLSFPRGGTLPDKVTAIAFSPDGMWLLVGFRNGGVLRWRLDGNDKAEPFEWHAHDGEVAGLAFSPDSKWVFTGGHDGRVKRWPIDGNGKDFKAWPPNDGRSEKIRDIKFWTEPRSGILALGIDKARLLDPDSMTEFGPGKVGGSDWVAPSVPGSYGRLAIHPANGTIVVSRGGKVEVSYWDRGILQPVATLADPSLEDQMAHSSNTEELSLHPSGMLLATVSPDEGVAKVWHLGRMELALAVPAIASGAIAFSPDGSMLAVAGDHVTTLYEVGGLNEHTFIARRGLPVRAMGLTHDGRLATIAGRPDRGSAVASVWDDSGKLIQTVIHRPEKAIGTGQYRIASNRESGWTAFHAGDDSVTWCTRNGSPPVTLDIGVKSRSSFDISIGNDGRSWIIDSGNRLTVRPAGTADKRRFVPVSVPWAGRQDLACVRAGGSHVLVGCENGFLRVLGLDGKLEHSLPCFPDPAAMLFNESANTVHAAALTEDGTRAIAGTEDGRLWLFRIPGSPLGNWEAHRDRVTTVAFDRTGDWLASGSRDRLVRLWRWNGETYQPYVTLQVPDGNPVRQVMFSPDGKRLYGLREKETAVRIWHLDKLRARFEELRLEP
jgi:WD40 repeat protein